MDIVTSCYAKLLHLAMLAIRTCESAAAKECVWHARVSSAQRPASQVMCVKLPAAANLCLRRDRLRIKSTLHSGEMPKVNWTTVKT